MMRPAKQKHEHKTLHYLKSEIKDPPCSAGPDFDYSSRVSTQCWPLHSCRVFDFFHSNSHKKIVLNWGSGDGSVFIDLNFSSFFHVYTPHPRKLNGIAGAHSHWWNDMSPTLNDSSTIHLWEFPKVAPSTFPLDVSRPQKMSTLSHCSELMEIF